MGVRAIAAQTGIPVGAVHRAKRRLEKIVAKGGQKAAAISQQLPSVLLSELFRRERSWVSKGG
jgi:hypothetical protein